MQLPFLKLFAGISLLLTTAFAQSQGDRIVAVIDEDVLLQSDIDNQYRYYLLNGEKDDGTLRCSIFENLLTSKLLLSKAKLDSLTVSEDQVESEVDRRLSIFIRQLGSVEELEKIKGKSLVEIRVELRPKVREQLLIDQQKGKITSGVTITPKEVKDFFQQIPKDSLPFLPAEVEMSHIVIKEQPSDEAKKETLKELNRLRDEISKGKISFEDAATKYSQDLGSARDGGKLGEFGRGQMVPEFEEVAYQLNEGQMSEPVESPFGYHVILLHKKIGDRLNASHILVKAPLDTESASRAKKKLDEIRALILMDSLSFEQAAVKYSEDNRTKNNNGSITTEKNDTRVPLDQLDADLYLKIDKLKINEISEPMEFISAEGNQAYKGYHIVKLKNKLPPHQANMKDDYQKFYNAALEAKQMVELEKWFVTAKQQVYIEIKPGECASAMTNWK